MRTVFIAAVLSVAAVMLLAWVASPSEPQSPDGRAHCESVVIDWVGGFQVEGVRYYMSIENMDVSAPHGPEVARVQFNVAQNVCDPGYRLKDGDATFLPVGTPIHAVAGYDRKQVLAVAGQVYEARPQGGALGADQLPFQADAVSRIVILSQVDGSEVAAINDPVKIEAFVSGAMQSPVLGETAGDWDVFLEFQLEDGLMFRRTYNSVTGYLRDGIRLPKPAQEIIRDALR